MKKSRHIHLVLVSSFLASCVTHNPEEWTQQYNNTVSQDSALPPRVITDTIIPNYVVRLDDYWQWHGSFRPYTYSYRFCEPRHTPHNVGTRRPGSYLPGGFTPTPRGNPGVSAGNVPTITRNGFGAHQTTIAS